MGTYLTPYQSHGQKKHPSNVKTPTPGGVEVTLSERVLRLLAVQMH